MPHHRHNTIPDLAAVVYDPAINSFEAHIPRRRATNGNERSGRRLAAFTQPVTENSCTFYHPFIGAHSSATRVGVNASLTVFSTADRRPAKRRAVKWQLESHSVNDNRPAVSLQWVSGWVGFRVPYQHIIGHFGDESFQSNILLN